MGTFLERLRTLGPQEDWGALDCEATARLDRFSEACPLYARLLEQRPSWALWLESKEALRAPHRFHALLAEWSAMRAESGTPERGAPPYASLLRRFRRKSSMRIAYRDISGLATDAETVEDLTRLAEFCLRECLFIARERWSLRLGEPWDDQLGKPARFCVLALGKLGGQELNFSSDIDLVYLYEGEGQTRRDGQATPTTSGEFFHRLGETITQLLNERDAEGFLFRADLRLRPGGATGPLVPCLEAVEHYYAATGQTWERLALLKARPVAGDFALGAELLESLHSFRYPRHPPPSLLAEVAAMKQRTEFEVIGTDALERNIKSGRGGIREIEFLVQARQLLHAGRFPFLQTHSTIEALKQLVRYELIDPADASFLIEAYWFFRRVEHRLQMGEEQQTHELPTAACERGVTAHALGFSSVDAFDEKLEGLRTRVRRLYSELFSDAAPVAASLSEEWWAFFASGRRSPRVLHRLEQWFGDRADAAERLRRLVRESEDRPLMRDQVNRFADLVPALDRVLPRLARPIETLKRIADFGDRYASRAQFLSACTMNPEFFEVLALLFDRSRFIHELLCRHPEVFDEVLRPEILRKDKDLTTRMNELAQHPGEPADDFRAWLWLYVRAEQIRVAIGQLLGFLEDDHVARQLSDIAAAVVGDLLRRTPGGAGLLVVALGKLAGRELSFGSDLDIVFVGPGGGTEELEKTVRAIRKTLSTSDGRDAVYALDLRLRPYGDAGPLIPAIETFDAYFGTSAQAWERQALSRARILTGPRPLAARWAGFIDRVVFGRPLRDGEADELWKMRLRVQKERDTVVPAERAFKTGAGGLVDIEFALQLLQLHHGHAVPEVRTPETAAGWLALAQAGLVDQEVATRLLANLRHIRRVEWALRREANRSVTVIPEAEAEQAALAKWLEFPSREAFWEEHCRRMEETRRLVVEALDGVVSSTALEPGR